ncbi:hypothetical protein JI739_09215 [Ramlibacter sp. AW1]|uniref:Uncharacterized protein n=1 Tax=Ramlibacter aurantiacus TaxID=2801330 RepID=A0A936ZFE8_9BURK|nr:hypothetical protein [Ramlibacter aurantiacus]
MTKHLDPRDKTIKIALKGGKVLVSSKEQALRIARAKAERIDWLLDATGSMLDLGATQLPTPSFGPLASDWDVIGSDFAAVGKDMSDAVRADMARRSRK